MTRGRVPRVTPVADATTVGDRGEPDSSFQEPLEGPRLEQRLRKRYPRQGRLDAVVVVQAVRQGAREVIGEVIGQVIVTAGGTPRTRT